LATRLRPSDPVNATDRLFRGSAQRYQKLDLAKSIKILIFLKEECTMRKTVIALLSFALFSATTAQAAHDAGLSVQNYRSAAPQSGVGAQLGMTLKLDSKRAVRDSERVQIGFAAGPVMAVQDAKTGAIRRGIGNMAGLNLRPGYSATLTFAGQPIETRYTVLGADEQAKDEANKPEKKKRKGPSTVGYVAIGIGALALGAAAAFFIAFASQGPTD
jgi:hypothetical protein